LAKRVVFHVLFAILIGGVHILTVGTLFFYTHRVRIPAPTLQIFLSQWLQSFIMSNLVSYSLIVGAYYAYVYYRRFNESARHAAELSLQTARLQHDMSEARLQALRMELNPHFLFNTLNSVSGLVRRGENNSAVRMLAMLGDLLRSTLDRELASEVSLEQELQLLDVYLNIERVRFADRLTVDVRVDEDVRAALVPSFALQPLVENAIRHGIGKRTGAGMLAIEATRDDGELVLKVTDTGEGFRGSPESGKGVGLSNTRARLEHLYGARGSLSLENWNGGARVTMRLPFHTAPRAAT
jgi:two-component system, LytTR family, sensor kinase